MSIPTGAVIDSDSLASDITKVGDTDETIKIQGHLETGGKLEIGTSKQHSAAITMNNKVYTSTSHSGAHTTGGIATWDASQHFSIFDGKEIRFYNYWRWICRISPCEPSK